MDRRKKISLVSVKPLLDNKFAQIFLLIDRTITKNFKFAGVLTRPVPTNGNGLWCCLLLPAILLSNCILYHVGLIYHMVAFLSIGLLIYSLLFIVFIYMSTQILQHSFTSGCTVSTFIATILIYCYLDFGFLFSLIVSAIAVVLYCYSLHLTVTQCPKTFTVGEAMIVCQGCILFFMGIGIDIYTQVFESDVVQSDNETFFIHLLIFTALSTVGFIYAALMFLNDEHQDNEINFYVVTSAVSYALVFIHSIYGPSSIPWFFICIFRDRIRIFLFIIWLFLLCLTVLVVYFRTEMEIKATSVTRKIFHILGSLVFISGTINDEEFMIFAAGLGLGLLFLVETLRVSNIARISSKLQLAFDIFSDEKDSGIFAMTPIYLYCGLACPLALMPRQASDKLALLSGVLSIGIGDSAASCFGERYGQTRWPEGERTVEGTACNIFSQIFVIYILEIFELLDAKCWLFRTAVAATVAGLAESQMEQVDNLVLPLVTLLAFQATAFAA